MKDLNFDASAAVAPGGNAGVGIITGGPGETAVAVGHQALSTAIGAGGLANIYPHGRGLLETLRPPAPDGVGLDVLYVE